MPTLTAPEAAAPTRGTVSESIYDGPSLIIPMADVQHIEKQPDGGIVIVTCHTRWNVEQDVWANNAYIGPTEAQGFLRAWCTYRSELEADTLADLTSEAEGRA